MFCQVESLQYIAKHAKVLTFFPYLIPFASWIHALLIAKITGDPKHPAAHAGF